METINKKAIEKEAKKIISFFNIKTINDVERDTIIFGKHYKTRREAIYDYVIENIRGKKNIEDIKKEVDDIIDQMINN